MITWLDNTGLHSAGRALDRNGVENIDADGLLQLLTHLIFSDTILLNSFEPHEVFERSASLLVSFRKMGIPSSVFKMASIEAETYRRCCDSAAERFASDHEYMLPCTPSVLAASLPELSDRTRRFEARIEELVASERTSAELQDRAENALSRKAAGAVEYMLAACHPLWKLVRTRLRHGEAFSESELLSLGIMLRYYLNEELAKECSGFYGPAIARAEMVRRTTVDIVSSLERMVHDAAKNMRARSLISPVRVGIPRIAVALVKNARGKPEKMVELAAEMRNLAAPLRQHLTPLADQVDPETGEGLPELDNALIRLAEGLGASLGIGVVESSGLLDALEFQVNPFSVIGEASQVAAKASGATCEALIRRLRHSWTARRLAVLVKLSKTLAVTAQDDVMVNRFYATCRGQQDL